MVSSSPLVKKQPSRPVYHCDKCTKTYNRPCLLEQHQRSHTGERPFQCTQCDKLFLRKSHLTAHLVSHSSEEEKPFKCKVCGKGVNSAQHLKRHEVTHTKSFQCPHCEETFYKHQLMRHHIRREHEKPLQCKDCGKQFSRPNRLTAHQQKYHGEHPTYQCDHPGCFKTLQTWSALQLHVKDDHPKLICPICGRGCVGQRGLDNHMLCHGDDSIKLWKCNYCVAEYPKKAHLIDHYDDVHDGNIPEELLKPKEKVRLQALLSESTISGLPERTYDSEASTPPTGSVRSDRSLLKFNNTVGKTDLKRFMTDNYISHRYFCPRPKCDRTFAREYDLRRHVLWHEEQLIKINAFLEGLEAEERAAKEKELEENGNLDADIGGDSSDDDDFDDSSNAGVSTNGDHDDGSEDDDDDVVAAPRGKRRNGAVNFSGSESGSSTKRFKIESSVDQESACESDEEDAELDAMIDNELKQMTAGSVTSSVPPEDDDHSSGGDSPIIIKVEEIEGN